MDDVDLAEQKKAMRLDILAQRNLLALEQHKELSKQACQRLMDALEDFQPSPVLLGLFWPIRSEIDCLSYVAELRERGYRLALPVVTGEVSMEFRLWEEGDQLESAGYGSMGPSARALCVAPDCLVMPLAAFDQTCQRLGYGGGFYDRYILDAQERGQRPLTVGMAFALQEVDRVPIGRYDQALDRIVTDRALIS